MNKNKILTKQWNNILTFGLGIPTLIYSAIVLSVPLMSDFVSFIGLVGIGVVY